MSILNITITLHHHIGAESVFERGLGITSALETYESHVRWFEKEFDIIDMETFLHGPLPKKPLLMTFDDPFQSVAVAIEKVLAPKGLPSVCFLNPGFFDDADLSLDRTLAWAVNTHGVNAVSDCLGLTPHANDLGDLILNHMAVLGAKERTSVKQRIVETFGMPDTHSAARSMTKDDVQKLTTMGVEIGNHTKTHIHGRSLKQDEYETEIIESQKILEDLSGQKVRSFALPYGHDADLTPDLITCLRDSGHEALFLVQARSNYFRPGPDIWHRVSLQQDAVSALPMKVKYKPILRTIKKAVTG